MSQTTLRKRYDAPDAEAFAEPTAEQVIRLAQELRFGTQAGVEAMPQDAAVPEAFPNFSRFTQRSGRLLLANDIAALFLAFVAGGLGAWAINIHWLSGGFQKLIHPDTLRQFAIFGSMAATSLLWLDIKGHYRQRLPYWESVGHIVAVTGLGFIGSGFVEFVVKDSSSRLWVGLSWALFGGFLFISRALVRRGLERRGLWRIPALMIGTGPTAEAALDALNNDDAMGFRVIGRIPPASLDHMTRPQMWKQLLLAHKACHIFLALEGGDLERQQAALKALGRARVPCSIVPPWMGLPSSTLSPHHFMMQDVLLLHDTNRLELPLPRMTKRAFDFTIALLALVALAPLFAVLALLVRCDGGAALFSQLRVGRNGRLFRCYKFRSMCSDAERVLAEHLARDAEAAAEWQKFQKLKDDVRVTALGRFIRRTSLDELPQLFNVLIGDMSLVGPRPILQGQEHLYAEDFGFYTAVRPGISGPWQVSGRNRLTFRQRVALESWYARNWSLWMDVVILLKTVPTVLKRGQAF